MFLFPCEIWGWNLFAEAAHDFFYLGKHRKVPFFFKATGWLFLGVSKVDGNERRF